ncbi:MAG TPA: type III pantothenate kinase [Planctomycetota bacterium]|nr:type III pantothenate kinase [Planctomycetota bacterium]
MGASLLTVDLGNSAAKLRAWQVDSSGALVCGARLEVASEASDPATLEPFFAAHPRLELAAMSSVAGERSTASWRELLAKSTRARLFDELSPGLDNQTREPERVGRDRLFAARGALEWIGESALVVDVGTALTVDVLIVRRAPSSAAEWPRGEFLGGAIAPGPQLLARALSSGAARLFEVVPEPDPPALGRDSAAAMRSGVGVGIRGAARELSETIAREAGLVDPPIALTGGARAFVASVFTGRRVFESEDLVHYGLCAALLQQTGLARPRSFQAR